MNKFKHEKLYLQVILNDTDNTYHTTLIETKLEVAEYKHKIISKIHNTHIYVFFENILFSNLFILNYIYLQIFLKYIYIYSQLHRTETRKNYKEIPKCQKAGFAASWHNSECLSIFSLYCLILIPPQFSNSFSGEKYIRKILT